MEILLQDIIDEKGLTLLQVESMTGVHKSTISDICHGFMPRMDTLEDLAKGLDVQITDLFNSPYK